MALEIREPLHPPTWMNFGVGTSVPLPPTVAASLIFERGAAT